MVADGHVQRSFIDSIYCCGCVSWVTKVVGELENVGAVTSEGVARWSQNGFTTSCQCRYDVAIGWVIWVVSD